MAKIIQLAKDFLRGGHKENIYPKTLDTAVLCTDSEGNATDYTLKEALEELYDAAQSIPNAPYRILVNNGTSAISLNDKSFAELLDLAQDLGGFGRMYIQYRDKENTIYELPLVKYIISPQNEPKLVFASYVTPGYNAVISQPEYLQVIIYQTGDVDILSDTII